MTIKYVFKSFGSRSLDSDNYPTFFVARQGISAPTWFGRNITMGDPREHLRAKLNSDSVVNVINAKMSEIAKDADLENQLKAELIRQLKYSDRKEGEGGHKELARKLVDKLKNRQFKLRTGREFLGGETDEMIKAVFNVVMKKTSPQNQDIIKEIPTLAVQDMASKFRSISSQFEITTEEGSHKFHFYFKSNEERNNFLKNSYHYHKKINPDEDREISPDMDWEVDESIGLSGQEWKTLIDKGGTQLILNETQVSTLLGLEKNFVQYDKNPSLSDLLKVEIVKYESTKMHETLTSISEDFEIVQVPEENGAMKWKAFVYSDSAEDSKKILSKLKKKGIHLPTESYHKVFGEGFEITEEHLLKLTGFTKASEGLFNEIIDKTKLKMKLDGSDKNTDVRRLKRKLASLGESFQIDGKGLQIKFKDKKDRANVVRRLVKEGLLDPTYIIDEEKIKSSNYSFLDNTYMSFTPEQAEKFVGCLLNKTKIVKVSLSGWEQKQGERSPAETQTLIPQRDNWYQEVVPRIITEEPSRAGPVVREIQKGAQPVNPQAVSRIITDEPSGDGSVAVKETQKRAPPVTIKAKGG